MSSKAHGKQKAAAAQAAQAEYRRAISTARHAVTRALAEANTEEERQLALRKMHLSQKSWRAESRYQILVMSLEGQSASEIAARFGLHVGTVKNILSQLFRQRTKQTAGMIDLHREILLSRAEMIVEKYAPIALNEDLFERIERGEPVSATSLSQAMRSALIMLAAANFECRLLGLFNGPLSRRKPKTEAGQQSDSQVWWPSKVNCQPSESPQEEELTFPEEIPRAEEL